MRSTFPARCKPSRAGDGGWRHGARIEPTGPTTEESKMNTRIQTVLLTGKTHTTASHREGASRGDERLDIQLSTPGNAGNDIAFTAIQAHPAAEQLFAGAWSACYSGALGLVAKAKKVSLPADLSVDIEVDLGRTGEAYFIQARFEVRMPGVALDTAESIAHAAHEVCPYSKAVHGNIDIAMNVTTA
jgi:osmotically inducible protein OsmC